MTAKYTPERMIELALILEFDTATKEELVEAAKTLRNAAGEIKAIEMAVMLLMDDPKESDD